MYAFRFTLSHRCCLFLGGNYPILCAGNPMFHKPFAVFWCSVDVFPVDPSIPFFECNIYTNEPPKVASANMRFPLVNPLIYHIVLEHYGFILLWCGPSSIHCAYVYIYINISIYIVICVCDMVQIWCIFSSNWDGHRSSPHVEVWVHPSSGIPRRWWDDHTPYSMFWRWGRCSWWANSPTISH